MDFGELLPPRPTEDILAERIRLTIGGEVIDLPVLTIAENRAWKERSDRELGLLLAFISTDDDLSVVLERFDGYDHTLMDLLVSYDTTKVLPYCDKGTWCESPAHPLEHVEEGLTPLGLFRAVCEVWRAARPLADIARTGMMSSPPMTPTLGQRMRTWLRNMAGPRGSSSAS